MPRTSTRSSTRRQENGGRVPEAVRVAVEEYAKGLEARGDMTEAQREEAVRHYEAGLLKFHKQ